MNTRPTIEVVAQDRPSFAVTDGRHPLRRELATAIRARLHASVQESLDNRKARAGYSRANDATGGVRHGLDLHARRIGKESRKLALALAYVTTKPYRNVEQLAMTENGREIQRRSLNSSLYEVTNLVHNLCAARSQWLGKESATVADVHAELRAWTEVPEAAEHIARRERAQQAGDTVRAEAREAARRERAARASA